MPQLPESAPAANPVFYRTYSRHTPDGRESLDDVINRSVTGLVELGKLTPEEELLVTSEQEKLTALPSGRWLWVGGTPWLSQPENFSGGYNCTSTSVTDWESFGLMMALAMMGSGTGAVLEPHCINQLPTLDTKLNVKIISPIGDAYGPSPANLYDHTLAIDGSSADGRYLSIQVGDSRQGWCKAYQALLEASSSGHGELNVYVDLSLVRPPGTKLKGFGGTANPAKLTDLFARLASILNRAHGRRLSSTECCLLIDEAALVVVAGNVRRSAGMRQFAYEDHEAAASKDNLWSRGESGAWRIDPEKDALRMANHTRVAHTKPPYEDILEAVTKQFYSGEGAIQYAPEAIYRGNVDLIPEWRRAEFLNLYCTQGAEAAKRYFRRLDPSMPEREIEHRLQRYGLNPCGEINGKDFHCNLAEVHLNRLDPDDFAGIERAFKAAAISVASLLHHKFEVPRYRYSREIDPIVGVSFTGLFDFFVKAFGLPWLAWWQQGRPRTDEGLRFHQLEAGFLQDWRAIVEWEVADYCERHGLCAPNRCTTVQPAGTKSLLTNASPGWHPPKAQRFIRRITFGKGDPVALACMDYGYTVVPSQSDTDFEGNLLDDPSDPRCTEWLVELPVEAPWADLPGADVIDISQFSALAQFDFYMQVQTYYTAHNTSATIEFREDEIEPLARAIHQAIQSDRGYISAALLARFDSNETFPRLPFEPITKEVYEHLHAGVLRRRKSNDFLELLRQHDSGEAAAANEAGPAGCDSDKCMLPEARP